jgi:hypothetical protein
LQLKEIQRLISFFQLLTIFTMASTSISAQNLFNVDGLVAVITGGGSGEFLRIGIMLSPF